MSVFATIDAKPEPISVDPARTAVIVVDMQNDFGAQGGMFAQAGIDIAPIRKVIEPTKAVLTASRRAGVKVVYLKMEFHPDLSNAGPGAGHMEHGDSERTTASAAACTVRQFD